ncbi:MAG: hypothetical protein U9N31_05260 [Candidatus Marinimicrobia bacterium]|nr:hypothetical protein [Candidatus Neomarinimicrobiota bacterium]
MQPRIENVFGAIEWSTCSYPQMLSFLRRASRRTRAPTRKGTEPAMFSSGACVFCSTASPEAIYRAIV